ncbi:MAG: hypothetical protein IJ673_08710 [Treponema sp.]|nr:hypothetical protein [Treponema sp.]
MKKRLALCILLFGLSTLAVFSLKYRRAGEAEARYVGSLKDNPNFSLESSFEQWYEEMVRMNPYTTHRISKLSKTESELLWDALSDYNYSPGDIYIVVFQESGSSYAGTLTCVINADGRSCNWAGAVTRPY